VALLRADASLGTRFWAHASWWVRQAMQRLVSELTRPVVLSDRSERGRARNAERRRVQARGHAPPLNDLVADTRPELTLREIAGRLGVSAELCAGSEGGRWTSCGRGHQLSPAPLTARGSALPPLA
jgi:hypothetical protein